MIPISILRKLKKINPYIYPLIDERILFDAKTLSKETVIKLFEEYFKTSMLTIQGKTRTRKIVYLRMILVDALMNRSHLNLVETARVTNKHHTSIINQRDNLDALLKYDDFKAMYHGFNKALDEYENQ